MEDNKNYSMGDGNNSNFPKQESSPVENTGSSNYKNKEKKASKEKPVKPKKSVQKEILEWVQAIAIAVVIALLVRNFVFTVVKVDGKSMESTLQHGDRMVVWRLGYDPEAGDIVVFNPPGQPEDIFWIKRVIATEGQTVKIDYDTNSVYVTDVKPEKLAKMSEDELEKAYRKLDEPYMNDCQCIDCERAYGGDDMVKTSNALTEVTVPKGCVFVMGDNRNHSSDGRVIGPVSTDRIVGEAVLRFWPFGNMSTF